MLVGIMLTAYLAMVSQQQTFTQRSQIWNHCIPTCESGIEEALAHINHSSAKTSFEVNDWKFDGAFYRKERPLNLGWTRMAIDTSMPPVITVVGDLRAPLQTNWVSRAVRVRTQYKEQAINGMLARTVIDMNGASARIDSFNSTNMAQSNHGQYDQTRSTDHAFIGTISQTPGNLNVGNVTVYGSVATGAEGTVTVGPNGSVGSTAFNNDPSSSGVEDGHSADDLNIVIDDQVIPEDFSPGTHVPGRNQDVNGTNYGYVFGQGDYKITGDLSLNTQKETVIVTNKTRLWVTGMTSINGQAFVLIGNNASLELYAGGSVTINGGGVVNYPGFAKNFSLIGLNGCTDVKIAGNAPYVGTINAPNADVALMGTSDVFGAVVGKTIKVRGDMQFHYDEALPAITKKGRYIPYWWEELKPEDFAGLFKK